MIFIINNINIFINVIQLKQILLENSVDFLSKVLPVALKHKKQFQIPASITLVQAWLESGQGESNLTKKYHNWFGITCGGYKNCVTLKNKQTGRLINWRKYATDQECFDDHARLLVKRYKKYVKSDDISNDYEAWAKALTQGGYAGSNYGSFIIQLIKQQNFNKFDESNASFTASICNNCDCWTARGKSAFWNGKNKIDGKTVPKISISKSDTSFKITYEGAPSGFLLRHGKCLSTDTIHQLCNVFVAEVNVHLESRGLKPNISQIEMVKTPKYFSISVPLTKIPPGTGYYIIDRRGGMGHPGDFSPLTKYENQPNYESVIKTAGNIREKFITHSKGYEQHILDNRIIRNVIGSVYYVLVENPNKYFYKFKSYNPLKGGDDETGAAKWFETWFNTKFKQKLNQIKQNTTKQNKMSIESIEFLVNTFVAEILAGTERSYPLKYYVYDFENRTYKEKTVNFKWSYL
jgi:hypothetical protein